jgi:hypothetical protein
MQAKLESAVADLPANNLTARTAIEWRRERDLKEPLRRDLAAERKARIRDFVHESLQPARNDLDAVLLSLSNDDVGAVHHFRRVLAAVKCVAVGMRELAK